MKELQEFNQHWDQKAPRFAQTSSSRGCGISVLVLWCFCFLYFRSGSSIVLPDIFRKVFYLFNRCNFNYCSLVVGYMCII